MRFDESVLMMPKTEKPISVSGLSRINPTDLDILYVFWLSENVFKKTELTTDEIYAGYYNIFIKGKHKPIKTQKFIVMRLFVLKGEKNNNGLLETPSKGIYKIRKPVIQEHLYKQYTDMCKKWEKEYKNN